MTHSFIAYIDESGDDGLTGRYRQAGINGGASHWLCIGATLWRYSRDLDAVGWAKNIISQLPSQRQKQALHFADLNHPQRIMAINAIADKPLRISCVMTNKLTIPAGIYTEKNQLYHYMTRYLIERISWLCRDLRPKVPEGDGRVKIIFSRRGGMSYEDFRLYMRNLKSSNDSDIRIHWPVIDIESIDALDHSTKFGLQIADLAISGLSAALEPDYYGNSELRFANILKQNVYNRNGNYLSYGIKIVPNRDRLQLNPQQLGFINLFGG